MALVDRARAALNAGDAVDSIRYLDDYDRRYPGGLLSQEATVLRVEALAKSGDAVAAADLGARFFALHPASPHAARVRRLIRAGANP